MLAFQNPSNGILEMCFGDTPKLGAYVEVEEYFKNKKLNLRCGTAIEDELKDADFIIFATPTNYDPDKNYFDTSLGENVIE